VPFRDEPADGALHDAFTMQADVKAWHETEWNGAAKANDVRARALAEPSPLR
jgi:hypothetical protein